MFRSEIEVNCPPREAFDVYLRVEDWPQWNSSVTSVRRLDSGPLRVGSRTRLRQRRLPVAEWVVTDLVPGKSFTWEATGPGVRTTARHMVRPHPAGCVAVGELEQRGALAPLVAALTRKLIQRYLDTESRGLKAQCESNGS